MIRCGALWVSFLLVIPAVGDFRSFGIRKIINFEEDYGNGEIQRQNCLLRLSHDQVLNQDMMELPLKRIWLILSLFIYKQTISS